MTIDPLVGHRLGPCLLEQVVGLGGNGVVYRGRHVALDRVVAVKVIPLKTGELEADRWLTEARAAARVQDQRIVQVHDAGIQGAYFYVVMQLIDGETLADIVRREGPLPQERALHLMREAIRGILVAHRAGLVHRDIKPDNIMVAADGSVKILDFGCAASAGRVINEEPEGSWDFAAPEQGYGSTPDPRQDLYSFGATYFYLLAGRAPFRGMTPAEVVIMHRKAPVPDVREARKEVLPAVAALIMKLMSKDAAKRFPDAEAVLKELMKPEMSMEMDPSGSPFKIIPPPEPQPQGLAADPEMAELVAQQPVLRKTMPAPPPPVSLPHKPRFNFVVLILAGLVFCWDFPASGFAPPDWLGAAACSAALMFLVAAQDKRTRPMQALAVLGFAGMAYSLLRAAGPLGGFGLEAVAAAALGAAAGVGGVVLAFFAAWRDRKTGVALLAASLVLLALASAGWSAGAEGGAWLGAARLRLEALFTQLSASGGLRRWQALAAGYAVYAVRRSFG